MEFGFKIYLDSAQTELSQKVLTASWTFCFLIFFFWYMLTVLQAENIESFHACENLQFLGAQMTPEH